MDDILVLSPMCWKLGKTVKAVNEVLGSLRLEKHPGKTFIGRVEKGFVFPGLSFRPGRVDGCPRDLRPVRGPCDPAL